MFFCIVLFCFKVVGLGSFFGGGVEIFVDCVWDEIMCGKVMIDDWLNVMWVWYELGGYSSVMMMFGYVELLVECIEYFDWICDL